MFVSHLKAKFFRYMPKMFPCNVIMRVGMFLYFSLRVSQLPRTSNIWVVGLTRAGKVDIS